MYDMNGKNEKNTKIEKITWKRRVTTEVDDVLDVEILSVINYGVGYENDFMPFSFI